MTDVERRREIADVNYKEVHDIIFPADVRTTDSRSAKLTSRGDETQSFNVRVWKLSPLGIEIVLPTGLELEKGHPVDLKLQIARQNTEFEGLVVDVISTNTIGTIAGIRLSGKKNSRFEKENRRKSTRWQCGTQFYPVATCANPVEFNDFIYLRLKDVSANGFRAITSLRNKFLVPGMQLSLQVSFPMTGYCNIDGKISRADLTAEDGKDYLELGVQFENLSGNNRETIGQYLIQFGEATSLEQIRQEGFYPKSLVAGLDYTYVKTEAEFLDTLKLRHSANIEAGKIPEDFKPSEMSDIYDARSRIVNWQYQGKCVGTVRTTFSEKDEKLELEQFVDLPSELPRRDLIAEIGRAATHPDYRKSDLFSNLLQRVALLSLQANRTFVVMSTTEELLPLYAKIGMINSSLTYTHPLYPTKTQFVLYADIYKLLAGENVGFIAWNLVWKDVVMHLIESGTCKPEEILSSKTKIYKYLSPLAAIPRYFMRSPRKAQNRRKAK